MAAFEAAKADIETAGATIVAASVDPLADAQSTVERLGLTFTVGYGLPLHETAELLGAYYEDRRAILHATGFVLRRDGAVLVASYSSGAIGRLAPDDVLDLIRFLDAREKA